MRKGPSFFKQIRQSIYLLEVFEIIGLMIPLSLLFASLGMIEEPYSMHLGINTLTVMIFMGAFLLAGILGWVAYLVLIIWLRWAPMWAFVPIVLLTGGAALGLLVFASLFDLNRFFLARFFYEGEAPVEYFWSKESSKRLEAWRRGVPEPKPDQPAPTPEPMLPESCLVRMRYQAPVDLEGLTQQFNHAEGRGSPRPVADAFYGEMLYAAPENCQIAFLQLLLDGKGRGGLEAAEDLEQVWNSTWEEVKGCVRERLLQPEAGETPTFSSRLGKVQVEPLTASLARVSTQVIVEAAIAQQPQAAAIVQFDNVAVCQPEGWYLISGLPQARLFS